MDEQTILAMPEDAYMNEAQLAFFSKRLHQLKMDTLAEIDEARRQMIEHDQVSDVLDRASQEEEAMITLRLADRKRQLIPKIDAALQRIRSGDYGYCLASGDPIGIPRLLIRPTAEYCTDVKNLNEQRENLYDDRR